MTFHVVIERGAEADLRAIAAYLAEHGASRAAADFVAAVLERIESLEHFPARGAVPGEIEMIGKTRYRQILFGRYRILYRIEEDRVIVALIADDRRDMLALLRDRLLDREPTT